MPEFFFFFRFSTTSGNCPPPEVVQYPQIINQRDELVRITAMFAPSYDRIRTSVQVPVHTIGMHQLPNSYCDGRCNIKRFAFLTSILLFISC